MAQWQDRHQVVPAVYVILERDGKMLFIRRANTGYRDGEFSLPAGHLDGGEPAVAAAAREALEEVGVTIALNDLHLIHTQHRLAEEGDHERLNLFFKVTKWQGEPANMEPHKCDELRWASLDDLPQPLVPELHALFKQLAIGQNYGHFGFEKLGQ